MNENSRQHKILWHPPKAASSYKEKHSIESLYKNIERSQIKLYLKNYQIKVSRRKRKKLKANVSKILKNTVKYKTKNKQKKNLWKQKVVF